MKRYIIPALLISGSFAAWIAAVVSVVNLVREVW